MLFTCIQSVIDLFSVNQQTMMIKRKTPHPCIRILTAFRIVLEKEASLAITCSKRTSVRVQKLTCPPDFGLHGRFFFQLLWKEELFS